MRKKIMKHPEVMNKKPLFMALLAVLILFVGMLTVNEFKKSKYIGQEAQSTISVSATGEVYAKPDLAITSFSVVTEKDTAVESLTENSKSMNKVIEFFKNSGVEDKDLKTTIFRINPRYEWHDLSESSIYPTGERVLVGYEVTQTLQVKIRDMSQIGTLIEGATDAGATEVGSLQFTFDDEDDLQNQAREIAIDKAKAKAKELAKQLGVSLGRITNFNEGIVSPVFYDLKESYAAMGGGGAPTIETGENLIQSNIVITYEIN